MDLQQLRTFVTIAQEGNLTRASVTLCLSQPAVSAQIKALEDELGVKLFYRESRGMTLTPAGKILSEEAKEALMAARNVVDRAQYLRDGISGEFRLGTIIEPVILRLGEFLSDLIALYPSLHVSLSQGISGDIIDRVLTGRIDAGYVIGPVEDTMISAIKIMPITFRIVAPVDWIDKILTADWKAIECLPWISTPEKCSFNRVAAHMFARHGVAPQTVIEADQEATLKKLVASGIGLTLMREDVALAAEAKGELVIWPTYAEVSHLYFVYSRAAKKTLVLQAVLSVVRKVWQLSPSHH